MAGDAGRSGDDVAAETGGTPPVSNGDPLPLDAVFEVLADRRRRATLYCLRAADGAVLEFDSLVDAVTDLEAALGHAPGDTDHGRRVERDLDTWHLEVLEEVGIAEYDRRSGSVRYHGDPSLDRWVDRVRHEETRTD